jgi:site-specific DNA-cytosine methylase
MMNEQENGNTIRILDLYSGGGGSLLAGRLLGWSCACAVEFDPYACAVLEKRQADLGESFPIWTNAEDWDAFGVCPVTGERWRDRIGGVVAGFPCQPWSASGSLKGQHDHRNQWPTVARILRDLGQGCRFALLENVPNICNAGGDYFGQILADLEALGFDAVWQTRAASSVGANHRRARLWIYCWRS